MEANVAPRETNGMEASLTLSTRPPQPHFPSTTGPSYDQKQNHHHTPRLDANQTHCTLTKLIKKPQQGHGRSELECGRPQARRGGATVCQRFTRSSKARAGRPSQGPAVGASRPSGCLRRHGCHRLRKGQCLRRVPREEQAQQGAERQEEGGHERRQLRACLHRAVRQLQVPLQLHRLPGPRQAEESPVHLR